MKKKPSLSSLKKKAWKLFSEYVRSKHPAVCYTCGESHRRKSLQCGHAIGGRHNAVLFDEEICRPQCVACNVFRRGNYPIFTTKLIKENGMEWWEKKLEGARRIVKLTRSDMESLIAQFKDKLELLA